MTIEQCPHSGAWLVSAIINGRLVTRQYYGHTKREAVGLFRYEMSLEAQQ